MKHAWKLLQAHLYTRRYLIETLNYDFGEATELLMCRIQIELVDDMKIFNCLLQSLG